MYKLVIVDDEPTVRSFLRFVITKFDLPFNICGEGENGEQAVSLIEEHRPDFVIMDIQMPIMNGLEAAEIIKTRYPDIQIYLLTAYEYFEYAHKAIKINVTDYLLKPIKPEVIAGILQKGLATLKESRAETERAEELKRHVEPIVKKKLVYDFITGGKINSSEKVLAEYMMQPNMLRPGIVLVASLWDQDGKTVDEDLLCEDLARAIDELIGYGLYQVLQNGRIVVFSRNRSKEAECKVKRAVRDWEERHCLYVGVGIGPVSAEGVEAAFFEALGISRTALFWQNRGFFSRLNIGSVKYGMEEAVKLEKDILAAVLERKFSKADAIFFQAVDDMRKKFCHADEALFFFNQVITFLFRDSVDKLISEDGGESLFGEMPKYFSSVESYLELKKLVNELNLRINYKLDAMGESLAEKSVIWAEGYIRQHYDQDLTMEQLAKRLFISPTYFSKVFKKFTGECFINFITRIRIEEAEKLLLTGNYTVGEVSRKVGFCDSSYFSTVFKKHRKIPPKDFISSVKPTS